MYSLSVIIPHANPAEKILKLLESLNRQKCHFDFEVLVVSNPPEKYQTTPDFFTDRYKLKWLTSPAGANRARQKGSAESSGLVLLFLDDDCTIPDEFFLQRHFELHQADPLTAAFGGPYDLQSPVTLWGKTYHFLQMKWLDDHRLPQGKSTHLLGGNSSYKRSALEAHGYDEKIIFGGTETELQLRMRKAGLSFKLVSDLKILHDGDLSFFSFARKAFQQGIGFSYIHELHGPRDKFIFFKQSSRLNRAEIFAKKIYETVFSAGVEYYYHKKALKPKAWEIAVFTLKELIPNPQNRLKNPHRREFIRLVDPILIEKAFSARNNDSDSAKNRE